VVWLEGILLTVHRGDGWRQPFRCDWRRSQRCYFQRVNSMTSTDLNEPMRINSRGIDDALCYAAPDSSEDPLGTSTILPVTPPFPSNSCACLARSEAIVARSARDLSLLKEVEQGEQILSKQCRSQPLQALDAVGDHPFPAWEKPAAGDVPPEDRDFPKAMTTT